MSLAHGAPCLACGLVLSFHKLSSIMTRIFYPLDVRPSREQTPHLKGGGAGYPRGNRCCVQRKEPLWRESPLDLTKKIYSNSREIKKKWEKKRERFLCWKHESNDMFFIPTVAHTDAVVDPSSAPPYSLSLVGGLMLLRSLSTQHHFLEPPQFYFIFFLSSY